MAKSFFERLTGSIRVSEEDEEPFHKEKPVASTAKIKRRGEEPEEKIIHPVAADENQRAELPAEPDSAEEGQLTVDIYDEGSHIIIQSSMAGVKPEDIDISLQEDTLTIRGSRSRQKEVSQDNFYYQELYWGAFSRSIILPEEVEFQKADAVIKNGLLTVKLPKKDKGEKKIRVKIGD